MGLMRDLKDSVDLKDESVSLSLSLLDALCLRALNWELLSTVFAEPDAFTCCERALNECSEDLNDESASPS